MLSPRGGFESIRKVEFYLPIKPRHIPWPGHHPLLTSSANQNFDGIWFCTPVTRVSEDHALPPKARLGDPAMLTTLFVPSLNPKSCQIKLSCLHDTLVSQKACKGTPASPNSLVSSFLLYRAVNTTHPIKAPNW